MFGFERYIAAGTGGYGRICGMAPVDTEASADTLEKSENGFISDGFRSSARIRPTPRNAIQCHREYAGRIPERARRVGSGGWADRAGIAPRAALRSRTDIASRRESAYTRAETRTKRSTRRTKRKRRAAKTAISGHLDETLRLSERVERSRARWVERPNPRRKGTRGMSRLFGRRTRKPPATQAGRRHCFVVPPNASGSGNPPAARPPARNAGGRAPQATDFATLLRREAHDVSDASRFAFLFRASLETMIRGCSTPVTSLAATHEQAPRLARAMALGFRVEPGSARWGSPPTEFLEAGLRIAAQALQYWTGEGWEDPDCARNFAFG